MKIALALGGVVLLASIGVWTSSVPGPAADAGSRHLDAAVPVRPPVDTAALDVAAQRLRAQDPFRLDRRPAEVRYNPWEAETAAPPAPEKIRPALVLAALIGGPPWNAVIEGIPGSEGGVLLAVGAQMHGVTFVALRGDTVFLAGFDTTFALTARRAWQ
jgi:hypothetical protein